MRGSSPRMTKKVTMTIHLNTQADLDDAIHALVKQDPRLKPILERTGMPALRQREPGFAGLAAIICRPAGLDRERRGDLGPGLRPRSIRFIMTHCAAPAPIGLGRLGLSGAKIKTLKNLARELAAERLNLEVLAEEDADAAHNTLTRLHGIGPWTADVYLLFCLGHGDAWPAGDVAIQEAIKVGLGLKTRPTAKADGAAGGTVAAAARCCGASVVGLLQGAEGARRRDCGARKSRTPF